MVRQSPREKCGRSNAERPGAQIERRQGGWLIQAVLQKEWKRDETCCLASEAKD